MKKETYYCDECGAERKDANHWFVVRSSYVQGSPLGVNPFAQASQSIGNVFLLEPWGEWGDGIHLCGQSCAHAVLDRFMSTGRLEKPSGF